MHTGYKCDGCGQEPIRGGRFTCIECIERFRDDMCNVASDFTSSVDFCLDCAPKGLILENKPDHTFEHQLKPVRKKRLGDDLCDLPSSTADKDYLYLTQNYLDPNFVN